MTLGVGCEVIFSTPATRTTSYSPAATAENAWKKAEPLEAQAASKRVQGTPVIPIGAGDVRGQVVLADERRAGEVAEVESLHLVGA